MMAKQWQAQSSSDIQSDRCLILSERAAGYKVEKIILWVHSVFKRSFKFCTFALSNTFKKKKRKGIAVYCHFPLHDGFYTKMTRQRIKFAYLHIYPKRYFSVKFWWFAVVKLIHSRPWNTGCSLNIRLCCKRNWLDKEKGIKERKTLRYTLPH